MKYYTIQLRVSDLIRFIQLIKTNNDKKLDIIIDGLQLVEVEEKKKNK